MLKLPRQTISLEEDLKRLTTAVENEKRWEVYQNRRLIQCLPDHLHNKAEMLVEMAIESM